MASLDRSVNSGKSMHSFVSGNHQSQLSAFHIQAYTSDESVLKGFEGLTVSETQQENHFLPRTSSPIKPIQMQLVVNSDVEITEENIADSHCHDRLGRIADYKSNMHCHEPKRRNTQNTGSNGCEMTNTKSLQFSANADFRPTSTVSRIKRLFNQKRKYSKNLLVESSKAATSQTRKCPVRAEKEDTDFAAVVIDGRDKPGQGGINMNVKPTCELPVIVSNPKLDACRYFDKERNYLYDHKIHHIDPVVQLRLNADCVSKLGRIRRSDPVNTNLTRTLKPKNCNDNLLAEADTCTNHVRLAAPKLQCNNSNDFDDSEKHGSGKTLSSHGTLTGVREDEAPVQCHSGALTEQNYNFDVAVRQSEANATNMKNLIKMQSIENVERWLKHGYQIPKRLRISNWNHHRRISHDSRRHLSPNGECRCSPTNFDEYKRLPVCEHRLKPWEQGRIEKDFASTELPDNFCAVGCSCNDLHLEHFQSQVLSTNTRKCYCETPHSECNAARLETEGDASHIQTDFVESANSKLNPSLQQFMTELFEGLENQKGNGSDWSAEFTEKASMPAASRFVPTSNSAAIQMAEQSLKLSHSDQSCDDVLRTAEPLQSENHSFSGVPKTSMQNVTRRVTKSKKITYDSSVGLCYFPAANCESCQQSGGLQVERLSKISTDAHKSSILNACIGDVTVAGCSETMQIPRLADSCKPPSTSDSCRHNGLAQLDQCNETSASPEKKPSASLFKQCLWQYLARKFKISNIQPFESRRENVESRPSNKTCVSSIDHNAGISFSDTVF